MKHIVWSDLPDFCNQCRYAERRLAENASGMCSKKFMCTLYKTTLGQARKKCTDIKEAKKLYAIFRLANFLGAGEKGKSRRIK
jgi:hypothetical protein